MLNIKDKESRTLVNSSNVDVSVDRGYKGNCLYFQFKGTFDKNASELSTKAWEDEFENNPSKIYKHIWDCTKMKDFHFAAKRVWTSTLSKYESRIEVVYVIAESIVIRGAARLMTQFTRYELKVFKTHSEMYHFDQEN